jgi:hypothetical protein
LGIFSELFWKLSDFDSFGQVSEEFFSSSLSGSELLSFQNNSEKMPNSG